MEGMTRFADPDLSNEALWPWWDQVRHLEGAVLEVSDPAAGFLHGELLSGLASRLVSELDVPVLFSGRDLPPQLRGWLGSYAGPTVAPSALPAPAPFRSKGGPWWAATAVTGTEDARRGVGVLVEVTRSEPGSPFLLRRGAEVLIELESYRDDPSWAPPSVPEALIGSIVEHLRPLVPGPFPELTRAPLEPAQEHSEVEESVLALLAGASPWPSRDARKESVLVALLRQRLTPEGLEALHALVSPAPRSAARNLYALVLAAQELSA
jgi:hypothetical protein